MSKLVRKCLSDVFITSLGAETIGSPERRYSPPRQGTTPSIRKLSEEYSGQLFPSNSACSPQELASSARPASLQPRYPQTSASLLPGSPAATRLCFPHGNLNPDPYPCTESNHLYCRVWQAAVALCRQRQLAESLSWRPARSTQRGPGQPGLILKH